MHSKIISQSLVAITLASLACGAGHAQAGLIKKGIAVAAGAATYSVVADSFRPNDSYAADCTRGLRPSAEHVSKIKKQHELLNNLNIRKIAPLADPNHYIIFMSFDGTANHGEQFVNKGTGIVWPSPRYSKDECIEMVRHAKKEDGGLIYTSLPTNPRILYTLAATVDIPNQAAIYISGVGTDPNVNLSKTLGNKADQIIGQGMFDMVDDGMHQLAERVSAIAAKNPEFRISIVTTGFSRGATAARMFHNQVLRVGIRTPDGRELVAPERVQIAASILFDTVSTNALPSTGDTTFTIPPEIPLVVHIVAQHEYRLLFPLRVAIGPNVTEVEFPGSHSDIGGSYRADGISAVTLNGAMAVLRKLGVIFNKLHPDFYPNDTKFFIHDSRWVPLKNFSGQMSDERARQFFE